MVNFHILFVLAFVEVLAFFFVAAVAFFGFADDELPADAFAFFVGPSCRSDMFFII